MAKHEMMQVVWNLVLRHRHLLRGLFSSQRVFEQHCFLVCDYIEVGASYASVNNQHLQQTPGKGRCRPREPTAWPLCANRWSEQTQHLRRWWEQQKVCSLRQLNSQVVSEAYHLFIGECWACSEDGQFHIHDSIYKVKAEIQKPACKMQANIMTRKRGPCWPFGKPALSQSPSFMEKGSQSLLRE